MDFDLIFVGGGLATALGCLAVRAQKPRTRIAVVEQGARLGGSHTWCFHAADVPADAHFLEPLVVRSWPGYSVRFPRRVRRLESAYACVSAERVHDVVSAALKLDGSLLLLDRQALTVDRQRVLLADGSERSATLVVDARGPEQLAVGACGFQKFVGLELWVEPTDTIHEPVLMDACLPQSDGFRFMYVLPFDRERVLIEDTYFSDSPVLNEREVEREVRKYAAQQGYQVRQIVRRERGVLPMPLAGAPPEVLPDQALRAGYGGGYFHPVTGYSFPIAVRFAQALARDLDDLTALPNVTALARAHARQLPYLFALTRSMFNWFEPAQRYAVLEHFYRLPEALIERFYAAQLTTTDRARIFLGRPPRGLSVRRMFAARPEARP